ARAAARARAGAGGALLSVAAGFSRAQPKLHLEVVAAAQHCRPREGRRFTPLFASALGVTLRRRSRRAPQDILTTSDREIPMLRLGGGECWWHLTGAVPARSRIADSRTESRATRSRNARLIQHV